jgi:hypothetical protein
MGAADSFRGMVDEDKGTAKPFMETDLETHNVHNIQQITLIYMESTRRNGYPSVQVQYINPS